LAPFFIAVLLGNQVVRRIARGCIGRPLGPADIRVARGGDSARKDLLGFGQRG
jgi:hypothetical protein